MKDFGNDMEQCLSVLKEGGLILYPTDTVWGIGCDATNDKAVQRIYKLKERPDEKAMIVLVSDERDVLRYVAAPDPQVFEHIRAIEKPVTVIYDGAIGLAENLIARDGSIAIRICKEDFCRQLLKRFRKPVVSTSANKSGNNSPVNFAGIDDQIVAGVDYVVRYRQEEKSIGTASMVIRWREGRVKVLRP